MAALRWYRGQVADPPSLPRLRWYRGEVAGAVPAPTKLRWYRGDVAGAQAVLIGSIPNQSGIEPESTVTITAALYAGIGTPDSWTWRVVSGPATTIYGTGATVDITAPSHINGATVTIGVRATKDGITSPETTFTLGVLPQTEWWWTGTAWIPDVTSWIPATEPPTGYGAGPYGSGPYGS